MYSGKMEGIHTPSVEPVQKTWLHFVKNSAFLINLIFHKLKLLFKNLEASLDIKQTLLCNIAML